MNYLQDPIKTSTRVLLRYLQDHSARLAFGNRQRDSIIGMMRKGKELPADFYRIKWIRLTADRVMNVLKDARGEFGGQYPWDYVSPSDMRDVLHTALDRLGGRPSDE